jgi:hypothetical protein
MDDLQSNICDKASFSGSTELRELSCKVMQLGGEVVQISHRHLVVRFWKGI